MTFTLSYLLQSGLRLLEPETAHNATVWALRHGLYPKQRASDNPGLAQNLFGMTFSNPIGMAAGFDKDGHVPKALLDMGFGFVEVGTVTPKPQMGNEKPRVFRLTSEGAIINRMGFNNSGHMALKDRLSSYKINQGVIGVNIGANKTSQDPIEDYVTGIKSLYPVADYFTVNISSPNTPGLRDLQSPDRLNALLSLLIATRGALMEAGQPWRPILVKLAPDIDPEDLSQIIECLQINTVDGIIVSNTTVSRDGIADTAVAGEAGGLSGRPLFQASTKMLATVFQLTEGHIPLIGVGGIDTPEKALEKILAGASLIQIYTGLVYEGPKLIQNIKKKIVNYMAQHEYQNVSDMIGAKGHIWVKDH